MSRGRYWRPSHLFELPLCHDIRAGIAADGRIDVRLAWILQSRAL